MIHALANMSTVIVGQGYDATLQMLALLLLGCTGMAQLMTHGFRHATLFEVHLRPLSLCWLLLHLWDSAGHTAYDYKATLKYTCQSSAFHRWQPLAQEPVSVGTNQSKARHCIYHLVSCRIVHAA